MVVLDEHGVVQAHAVVPAAAGPNRPLLERPEERGRLPRVDDRRARPFDPLHQGARGGRDPREVAQEIQSHPLAREQGSGRALE